MQTQVQADCALQCLGHAAGKGRLKAGVCEYVAQQRGFFADIGSAAKGQGEEACSKGAGSREMLGPREAAGTALARRRAESLTKVAASVLQRPPSSRARTIN